MQDNGLLKYYKSLPSDKGFLDVSKIATIKNVSRKRGATHNTIGKQSFYVKCPISSNDNNFVKHIYDAEILLSQIYAKAGLTTAIYLPVTAKDKSYLVSDDISSPSVIPAVTHLYPLFGSERGNRTYLRPFPFLSKNTSQLKHDPNLILGREVMKQQTIMRILDVASFNDDRHAMNFFYDVQKLAIPLSTCSPVSNSQFENFNGLPITSSFFSTSPKSAQDAVFNLQNEQEIMNYYRTFKPQAVVSIDYGESGTSFYRMREQSLDTSTLEYSNDFDAEDLKPTQFKKELEESESLAELLDKKQLAETIGSLNPSAVAQDILQTTGYIVEPSFVDTLSQSYDDMAETLLK